MRAPTAIGPLGVALVLALLGCTAASGAQDPAPAPPTPAPAIADPEARLLEAELLELAEGRIDEAVEIYRAILATPDLSPALRARALFSIARAHRKRGELGAAKERYEELVANHPEQEKLVEAARRYLEEIAEGATRLPEFDWVAEVEENPQIQAQIFQWGMQLGGRGEEARKEAEEARRKLLSLGVLVVPVLEPMLVNSRDPAHREELAAVLIQLGRVRHIAAYVELSGEPLELQSALRGLPEAERSEALRIVSQLPADDPRHRWYAATTRLVLGDGERLESDLLTIIELQEEFDNFDGVWGYQRMDSALLPAARASLAKIAEASPPAYARILGSTLERHPALVELADLGPLLSATEDLVFSLIPNLQQNRPDLLLLLMESEIGATVYDRIKHDRESRLAQAYRDVPVSQRARLCRRLGLFGELNALALASSEAVPEYEDHLMRYGEDAPRRTSISSRGDPRTQPQRTSGPGAWLTRARVPVDSLPTHDAYEPALRRVVERGTDPSGRALAMESLAPLHPTNQEDTHALLLAIAGDPGANPELRVIALAGILLRLPEHESVREEIVARVDAICEESIDGKWLGRYGAAEEEPFAVGSVRVQLWEGADPVSIVAALLYGWRGERRLERVQSAVVPSIPRGQGVRLYRALHAYVRQHDYDRVGDSARPLAAVIGDIHDPALLRTLAPEILEIPFDLPNPPLGVWKRIVEDPELPAELRANFLIRIGPGATNPESAEARLHHELDWRALLLGSDPIAERLVVLGQLDSEIYPLRFEARGAPQIAVQRWGWRETGLPDTPEELERGLASDDSEVRGSAYRILLEAADTRWLPALHRAAREAPTEMREAAIDRLSFLAAEESLPVLTALLDDPVFAVRAKALEALEKIEATLSQQEKWRERFGKKKKD